MESKSTTVGKYNTKDRNKVNYKTVIEGHTAISTKMWRENNIHLEQNISIEALEEITHSSDAGQGKILCH